MSAAPERQVILRLRKAIGCPIHWEERFTDEWLCKELRMYWVNLARGFETDAEMMYYSRRTLELCLFEPALKAIEHNYPIWRKDAVEAYHKKTGFLLSLNYASPAEHSKHFPNPAWSREEIIHRTTHGDALFFRCFGTRVLDHCLKWSIAQRLLEVVDERRGHLFLFHPLEVGASQGTPTHLIRLDVDYNTPLAHGHPVLEKELPPQADVITEPRYAFADDDYDDLSHDIDEPDDQTLTPRRGDPMP